MSVRGVRRSRLGFWLRRFYLGWARFSQPFLGGLRAKWRKSLRLRVITIMVALAGVTVLTAGFFVLRSIGDGLYSARRDEALQDSARATIAAQSVIDASSGVDAAGGSRLFAAIRSRVLDVSASDLIYVRRAPGQESYAQVQPPFTTSSALSRAVTVELAGELEGGGHPQYWQAVRLRSAAGEEVPGIVVGSNLQFAGQAGTYELFIGYDLAETQANLVFVERTLLAVGGVMVGFIAVAAWALARAVFKPIRVAARTSRRIAAGEVGARMPMQNDEHLDVLSENFNEMADTLQARIRELDELSHMQQRFVSDVSHELRTPLTTIRLASQVLSGGGELMPAVQRRAIVTLDEQLDRFQKLLSDLLEISRYDAGRVVPQTEPTDLVRLVREEVEALQPLCAGERIEVVAPGGYTQLDVDPRRVRRIVSNLLGNAIEHSEGRGVRVSVDSNAQAVAVAVRDWGVGMSDEQALHAFDRFWRADPARKRTLGGNGLGLAIAREDAVVHGGVLEVWSALGCGANFRLTLPRAGVAGVCGGGVAGAGVGGTAGTGVVSVLRSPLALQPDDACQGVSDAS